MFARAALSLLGLLALFATRGSLEDQIRQSNPSFGGSQVDSALTVAITVGVVFGLIFLALYVLLALQVRKAGAGPGSSRSCSPRCPSSRG